MTKGFLTSLNQHKYFFLYSEFAFSNICVQTSLLVAQCGELKELGHFSLIVSRKSAFSMAGLSYSKAI